MAVKLHIKFKIFKVYLGSVIEIFTLFVDETWSRVGGWMLLVGQVAVDREVNNPSL